MFVRKYTNIKHNNVTLDFQPSYCVLKTYGQMKTKKLMNSFHCKKCGLYEFSQLCRHILSDNFEKNSYCSHCLRYCETSADYYNHREAVPNLFIYFFPFLIILIQFKIDFTTFGLYLL